jgi:hypothetical protein
LLATSGGEEPSLEEENRISVAWLCGLREIEEFASSAHARSSRIQDRTIQIACKLQKLVEVTFREGYALGTPHCRDHPTRVRFLDNLGLKLLNSGIAWADLQKCFKDGPLQLQEVHLIVRHTICELTVLAEKESFDYYGLRVGCISAISTVECTHRKSSTSPEIATNDYSGVFGKITRVDLLPPKERDSAQRRRGGLGPIMIRKRTTLSQLGRDCENLPLKQHRVTYDSVLNYFKGKSVSSETRFAIATALDIEGDAVP